MKSQIDSHLTPNEREILAAYRSPRTGLRRSALLSAGYAAGAGIFAFLAIQDGEPRYVLVVYVVLLLVMGLRLWRGHKLAKIMPGIIDKYETTIAELRGRRT